MDAERWKNLEGLFAQACKLAAPERDSLLDRGCGDDNELRQLLEKMLRAAAEDGTLLEPASELRNLLDQYAVEIAAHRSDTVQLREEVADTSETDAPQEPDPTAARPTAVDGPTSPDTRYQVLHLHATGGQGKVFLAFDHELHREVALKQLQARFINDSDSRTRFLSEAEITGRLEHPGIIPVYSLCASGEGRPFYAMRFVRGDSLKDAIAEFHEADDSKREPGQRLLALRRLLGRFIDVCNAVQYAHSRGILHRDLKPGNIMLGEYGETLVVDWGLAKTVGPSNEDEATSPMALRPSSGSSQAATLSGRVMGTPHYMSPEQAEGRLEELGPASDVYSLGATLYALLTGQPPFPGKVDDVLERVQSGDFAPPRRVNRRVAPALEAICLTAMARSPNQRYASAREMAADVERWMADEPVIAYREPWLELLARWARRNRAWVRAATAALVMVSLVSVAAVLFIHRARNNELAAKNEATDRFHQAMDTVDRSFTGLADVLACYPNMLESRRWLLEEAVKAYEDFAQNESTDPRIQVERARTYMRVGDLHRTLVQPSKARDAYAAAEGILVGINGDDSNDPLIQAELARSLARKGAVSGVTMGMTDMPERPETLLQKAEETLEKLVKKYPDNTQYRDYLGTSLLDHGMDLIQRSHPEEAEPLLDAAIEQFRQLARESPSDSRYLVRISMGEVQRGYSLYLQGRLADARAEFEAALLDSETASWNPEYLSVIWRESSRIYLALVLHAQGEWKRERDVYLESIKNAEELIAAYPRIPWFREHRAATEANLGRLLLQLGDTQEAESVLTAAHGELSQLVTEYPQYAPYREKLAVCLDTYARVLSERGLLDAALAQKLHGDPIDFFRNQPEQIVRYREHLALCHGHLGQALHRLGDRETADKQFKSAIETLQQLEQSNPSMPRYRDELALVHSRYGEMLHDLGKSSDSEREFRSASDLWQRLVEERGTPEYRHNLARFLVSCPCGDIRDSNRAIELAAKATGSAPHNCEFRTTLAAAHLIAGHFDEAIAHLREAFRLRPPDGNARMWLYRAMAHWRIDDIEEAGDSYRKGQTWLNEYRPGNLQLKRLQREAADLLGTDREDT